MVGYLLENGIVWRSSRGSVFPQLVVGVCCLLSVSMYGGFRVWYALGLVDALPLMGSLGLCGGHVDASSCGGQTNLPSPFEEHRMPTWKTHHRLASSLL